MLFSSPPIEVSCMPILYTSTNLPCMCMSRQEWTGSKVRLVFVISSWHWTMGSTLQQQLQHTHVVQQRDSVAPITDLKTVAICGNHYLWNPPFWIIAILEDLDSGQQGLCIIIHYFPKTHTSNESSLKVHTKGWLRSPVPDMDTEQTGIPLQNPPKG